MIVHTEKVQFVFSQHPVDSGRHDFRHATFQRAGAPIENCNEMMVGCIIRWISWITVSQRLPTSANHHDVKTTV